MDGPREQVGSRSKFGANFDEAGRCSGLLANNRGQWDPLVWHVGQYLMAFAFRPGREQAAWKWQIIARLASPSRHVLPNCKRDTVRSRLRALFVFVVGRRVSLGSCGRENLDYCCVL
jgi:hypothetical protein